MHVLSFQCRGTRVLISFCIDHEAMVGLVKSSAGADIAVSKPKVKKKEEPIEWSGFGS